MEKKGQFTNESLARKFKSNFELVNYAIQLAENMIRSGRDARVKSDIQNRAMLVLQEINEGKDKFDEIIEARTSNRNQDGEHRNEIQQEYIFEERSQERRRSRSFLDEE